MVRLLRAVVTTGDLPGDRSPLDAEDARQYLSTLPDMDRLMACKHVSCQCLIEGCGVTHPANWTPAMTITINGHYVGGDDPADCVAHYLLSLGYPTDRPDHLRKIAESQAARWSRPEAKPEEREDETPIVSRPPRTVTQK